MSTPPPSPLHAADGLHALRSAAAWAPLPEIAWIAITGDDRTRWLNGMATNAVQDLTPGDGAYTFFLNAQGRIQGDATIWAEQDRLLLQTDRTQVEPLLALLDRFIIMDDVELLALQLHGLTLVGPDAPALLQTLHLPAPGTTTLRRSAVADRDLTVIAAHSPILPRYELWSTNLAVIETLTQALPQQAPQAAPDAFELLRILEARPRFATDIRDRDLPQETAQTRALHFSKGCYLGQEIVERIHARGQVHRTFHTFVLHGAPPAPGTELFAESSPESGTTTNPSTPPRPVGILTSIASADIDHQRLALGYIRRDALDRNPDRPTPLHYTGGTAEARSPSAASKS